MPPPFNLHQKFWPSVVEEKKIGNAIRLFSSLSMVRNRRQSFFNILRAASGVAYVSVWLIQVIQSLICLTWILQFIVLTTNLGNFPLHKSEWKWKSLSQVPLFVTVRGIPQARTLERVAVSFSRGYSQPRNWAQVSCIAGRLFTARATKEAQEFYIANVGPTSGANY